MQKLTSGVRPRNRAVAHMIPDMSAARADARLALFMNTSAAIADPLLRRAFGRRARPSDPHRTARVRIGASGLRAPVSRRGSAISRRTVTNNAGWLTQDGLIWFIWFVLFIWFIRLVWFNQTNETNQLNQTDQINQTNQTDQINRRNKLPLAMPLRE